MRSRAGTGTLPPAALQDRPLEGPLGHPKAVPRPHKSEPCMQGAPSPLLPQAEGDAGPAAQHTWAGPPPSPLHLLLLLGGRCVSVLCSRVLSFRHRWKLSASPCVTCIGGGVSLKPGLWKASCPQVSCLYLPALGTRRPPSTETCPSDVPAALHLLGVLIVTRRRPGVAVWAPSHSQDGNHAVASPLRSPPPPGQGSPEAMRQQTEEGDLKTQLPSFGKCHRDLQKYNRTSLLTAFIVCFKKCSYFS